MLGFNDPFIYILLVCTLVYVYGLRRFSIFRGRWGTFVGIVAVLGTVNIIYSIIATVNNLPQVKAFDEFMIDLNNTDRGITELELCKQYQSRLDEFSYERLCDPKDGIINFPEAWKNQSMATQKDV